MNKDFDTREAWSDEWNRPSARRVRRMKRADGEPDKIHFGHGPPAEAAALPGLLQFDKDFIVTTAARMNGSSRSWNASPAGKANSE